ncbi:hypothetical protein CABS03_11030 [Colletotrichum abscissum]|uniref:Uncharacterized protein n=2 Tax=Colletotrichum abscissum TaxID=1671311 RepID=A0A9P9X7L1_9PEZI|nr:hypothetical protein CABS02_10891 [Colletotrichum abscissum]
MGLPTASLTAHGRNKRSTLRELSVPAITIKIAAPATTNGTNAPTVTSMVFSAFPMPSISAETRYVI